MSTQLWSPTSVTQLVSTPLELATVMESEMLLALLSRFLVLALQTVQASFNP
jgi:hypothetical protein